MKHLILLSGPVAVGKSAVALELSVAHSFRGIRTGSYLMNFAKANNFDLSRAGLQELGDSLDQTSDYRWLIDDVAIPITKANTAHKRWLLDSVRKQRQVEHFRSMFGACIQHVFLTAPDYVLEDRYQQRLRSGGEYLGHTTYQEAIKHKNEISARQLIDIADLVIDVSKKQPSDAATEITRLFSGNVNAPDSDN